LRRGGGIVTFVVANEFPGSVNGGSEGGDFVQCSSYMFASQVVSGLGREIFGVEDVFQGGEK